MTRAFLPMLLRSPEGHVVNTSSVNGFRATLGANFPHTAYSAAKFAVKGFTESRITDFRFNAPHLRALVVMPGHVGTGIARNSGTILGSRGADDLTDEEVEAQREVWHAQGRFTDPNASVEEIRQVMRSFIENFEKGGLTPDQAATIILDGIKADEWRILGLTRAPLPRKQTVLTPAINLYRKLGFVRVVGPPSPYARCNIRMELRLVG